MFARVHLSCRHPGSPPPSSARPGSSPGEPALLTQPAPPQTRILDPFQLAAVRAIDAGSSVLVAAPTGSGKTLIAEHAVERALASGAKAFYTTPLKALSNQKHRDLTAQLGAERVGLMTGDRVVNPRAPVVVMTTEVLRALLHDRPPLVEGLGVIVLDEFHYVQDPERGPVWEEVCIHAPSEALLVCLSATVSGVEDMADWLRRVHGPTEVIAEEKRPVVLNHLYAVGNLERTPPMLLPIFVDGQVNPAAELFDGSRRRQLRGEGLRQRSRARPCTPERSELLEVLRGAGMLPAIWFVLSRVGCDRAVRDLHAEGVRLTDEQERAAIRALADDVMGTLDARDLRAIGYGDWLAALEDGIAAHHGGMLPVQRELVEVAFAEGLVKLAFATETLALGVNLPARTVVIDRVVRATGERTGDIPTTVTGAEFAQLAGRAGRRGIDRVGHVVVPWSDRVPLHQVAALAGGRPPSLRSAFHPTAAMAANLVRRHTPNEAVAIVTSSLAQHLREAEARLLERDLHARREELAGLDRMAACVACQTDESTDATREPREDVDGGADDPVAVLSAGDVIVDPARPAFGRAVVVGTGKSRRGAAAVDVVHPDGRRAVVTSRDFRGGPVVIARLDLPEWSPQERGHARLAARALAELPAHKSTDLQAMAHPRGGPLPAEPQESAVRCGERRAHASARARLERVRAAVIDREHRIDDLLRVPVHELEQTLGLLRRRGHVDGWELTGSGEVVRRLFHESGLLVAECIERGLFDGLEPAEVAALASCFTARRRGPDVAPAQLPTATLSARWRAIGDAARELQRAEEDAGLAPTPFPEPILAGAVHAWASGADLEVALEGCDASAGDLAREVKQVVELLGQVVDALDGTPVADAARAACDAMLRGIVVASALDRAEDVRVHR